MNDIKHAPADPDLLRLLRVLAKGAVNSVTDGNEFLLSPRDAPGTAKRFQAATIGHAVSAGLIVKRGDSLHPAEPLLPFLKRAMLKERDEAFQEQHRVSQTVSVDLDGHAHMARRNILSSPLAALSRLKERSGDAFFPADALEAGERLAVDFHRGHLSPRITASWEPRLARRTKGEAGGAADITDTAMSARLRFTHAADAMGPELSGVAIDVCCFEKGLEMVERERQWPARSAKLLLRAALLTLARHYAPEPRAARRTSHHWGADGYRPSMEKG
ncbi:DUF6456 domain-containing protein [Agrobacterium tumefaciens]|uniref:DUF6456 domain-containing protein n=1 Tax=Agrobacterium tumefaciens TaxID=358 RepID=UPI00287EAF75|nr:DUF6456 domain-containing protein [Agrobacterium tumefaciens]MDS7596503.1 DUF6456 domain-containing protein [Agrobacterium tumefaciens]